MSVVDARGMDLRVSRMLLKYSPMYVGVAVMTPSSVETWLLYDLKSSRDTITSSATRRAVELTLLLLGIQAGRRSVLGI